MTLEIGLLADELRRGRLAIFAGAGISVAYPACVPLFRPLRDSIFRALRNGLTDSLPPDVWLESEQLFVAGKTRGIEPLPEVLFSSMQRCLGAELYAALTIMLRVSNPNVTHHFVSRVTKETQSLAITTNFEDGIERAALMNGFSLDVCASEREIADRLGQLPKAPAASGGMLWKIHGTLSDSTTIAITLDEIARENQNTHKKRAIVSALAERSILVIGYSGNDPDIADGLSSAAENGEYIFWLFRDEKSITPRAKGILSAWKDKAIALYGAAEDVALQLIPDLASSFAQRDKVSDCEVASRKRLSNVQSWADRLPTATKLNTLVQLTLSMGLPDLALRMEDILMPMLPKTSLGSFWPTIRHAELLKHAGRFSEQEEEVAKLISTFPRMTGPENWPGERGMATAYLLRQVGSVQGRAGLDPGLKALNKALELARAVQDRSLERYILHDIGVLYARHLDYAKALPFFEESRNLSFSANDVRHGLLSGHELAICELESGDRRAAIGTFQDNLQLSLEHGNLQMELGSATEILIATLQAPLLSAADEDLYRSTSIRAMLLAKQLNDTKVRFKLLVYKAKFLMMIGQVSRAEHILRFAGAHRSKMEPGDAENRAYLERIANLLFHNNKTECKVIFLPDGRVSIVD